MEVESGGFIIEGRENADLNRTTQQLHLLWRPTLGPLPLATSASLQGELRSPRRVTFDLRVLYLYLCFTDCFSVDLHTCPA